MAAEAAQDFAAARDKLNRKRKSEAAIKEVVQAPPALPVKLKCLVLRLLGPLGSAIVQAVKDSASIKVTSGQIREKANKICKLMAYTFICPKIQSMLIDPIWTRSIVRNTEDTLAVVGLVWSCSQVMWSGFFSRIIVNA